MRNTGLPHPQIGLISRESVTAQQVNTLLGILATLSDYLVRPNVDPANPHLGGRKDGESRTAAEVTFMAACDRLDGVINDDNRWSMVIQNALETRTLEMLDANVEFLRAQVAASKNLISPAFQYRPQLVKITDGSWVAILGDYKTPEACILGVGDSPAAALKDFDSAFAGVTTPEAIAWLDQQNLLSKTKPQPRKKRQTPE